MTFIQNNNSRNVSATEGDIVPENHKDLGHYRLIKDGMPENRNFLHDEDGWSRYSLEDAEMRAKGYLEEISRLKYDAFPEVEIEEFIETFDPNSENFDRGVVELAGNDLRTYGIQKVIHNLEKGRRIALDNKIKAMGITGKIADNLLRYADEVMEDYLDAARKIWDEDRKISVEMERDDEKQWYKEPSTKEEGKPTTDIILTDGVVPTGKDKKDPKE